MARAWSWCSKRTALAAVLLILAALPWCTALLSASATTSDVSSALRWAYGFQCHQRLSRSFVFWGHVLPVCARCTGIYFGMGLAVFVGYPRLQRDAQKAWVLVWAMLLLADVASEFVGLRGSAAPLRFTLGAAFTHGLLRLGFSYLSSVTQSNP